MRGLTPVLPDAPRDPVARAFGWSDLARRVQQSNSVRDDEARQHGSPRIDIGEAAGSRSVTGASDDVRDQPVRARQSVRPVARFRISRVGTRWC
jgi:hypothetical protein